MDELDTVLAARPEYKSVYDLEDWYKKIVRDWANEFVYAQLEEFNKTVFFSISISCAYGIGARRPHIYEIMMYTGGLGKKVTNKIVLSQVYGLKPLKLRTHSVRTDVEFLHPLEEKFLDWMNYLEIKMDQLKWKS